MKVISYSLFGYGKARQENCFDFHSYLRGLWINIRLSKVLYPDWQIMVHVDSETYNGNLELIQDIEKFGVLFYIEEPTKLCEAMLWRMKPIFMDGVTHTICRDTDSPLTYKEVQLVNEWIATGKVVHAITDSISHNIPLMGGMIGFTKNLKDKFSSWYDLINGYDYETKGSDQVMLNERVYPKFAQSGTESIVQHYLLGMPNTFLSGYRNTFNNIDVEGINPLYRETNNLCGHIGAAGYYEPPMIKFLKGYDENKNDYKEFELKYKHIFFWGHE